MIVRRCGVGKGFGLSLPLDFLNLSKRDKALRAPGEVETPWSYGSLLRKALMVKIVPAAAVAVPKKP